LSVDPAPGQLTLSIVSHGHGALAHDLLRDIARLSTPVEVLLTLNIAEVLPFERTAFRFPLTVLENPAPRGYGANHNAAFRHARGEYFCVLNPDVRLDTDPFPELRRAIEGGRHGGKSGEKSGGKIGVAAPVVLSPAGEIEDSARRFPTLASLAKKAFGAGPVLDYAIGDQPFSPDWVAGMFMLFPRAAFERAGGFDERYFLYYEDVDLCRRLRGLGYDVRVTPAARVVHDARRASRGDFRHSMWHLKSMLRYLFSSRQPPAASRQKNP
jgi:N-acetylglucosaminyl-diphospho-decaprenol L-rhamnosyltransferase